MLHSFHQQCIVVIIILLIQYCVVVPSERVELSKPGLHSLRGSHGTTKVHCDPSRPQFHDYFTTTNAMLQHQHIHCSDLKLFIPKLQDFTLKLIFTSDLHGHVDNLPKISEIVRKERLNNSNIILLDGGDISIGTIFVKIYGAGVMGEVMELMGYDAMALGNHDLEYAEELPKKIPILSVNIPGYFKSVIITRNGIKVGVIAYTTVLNTTFIEVEENIIAVAVCLRRAGADIVILLGHGMSSFNRRLSTSTRGLVDVIIGGHTHELLGCTSGYPVGDILIHPGAAGEYVGILSINRTQQRTSYYSQLVAITDNMPEEPIVSQWLAPKLAALPFENANIASIVRKTAILENACRRGKCVTGSVITQAMRWYYNCSVVSLYEAGSIRDVLPDGNISVFDLVNVMPWDNKVMLLEVTGRQLYRILERSVREAQYGSGEAFLHIAGLRYAQFREFRSAHIPVEFIIKPAAVTDIDAKHRGYHYSSEYSTDSCLGLMGLQPSPQIGFPEVARWLPNATYTIAVTDWISTGGDGYSSYLQAAKNLSSQVSDISVRDIVTQFLRVAAMQELAMTSNNGNKQTQYARALGGHGHSATELVEGVFLRTVETGSITSVQESIALHRPPVPTSSTRSVIAVLAEIPAMVVAYPLRTISTRQQSRVAGSGGGLWSGAFLAISAVLVSKVFFWVLYYAIFEQLSHVSAVASALHQGALSFTASMIAGIIEGLVMHPIWVVVVRLQVHGWEWKGMFQNPCGGVGFTMLLVLFPALRQFLFEYFLFLLDEILMLHSSSMMHGVIGMCAAIVATVLTYPLQTMRTQVQTGTFDLNTLKPFAGLGAKLLAGSVNSFLFFSCKKLIEVFVLS